jgi:hypothetical protein
MNIIKLNALKLHLEKLETQYCQQLSTDEYEVFKYYQEKLHEVRRRLSQVKITLHELMEIESNRHHLLNCLSQDSTLAHPDESESNL